MLPPEAPHQSLNALRHFERLMGPPDPDRLPSLPQLLDWTEEVYNGTPPEARYRLLFQVRVLEDDRLVIAGFSIVFVEEFSSASNDSLSVFLNKRNLAADDPICHHQSVLSQRDYPTAEAFFAAVRADGCYQFACGYTFAESSIYHSPRPVGTSPFG